MENKVIIEKNIEEINKKITQKLRKKRIINSSLRYTVLSIVGFIMLYPLLWMIGSSFKENTEIFRTVSFIPKTLNIENLSDGIYMLSIQNGGAKTTKKLVINK